MRALLAGLLLALPLAAAQAPGTVDHVEVSLATAVPEVDQGGVADAVLAVRFEVTAACLQDTMASAALELGVAGAGLRVQPPNGTVQVRVPAGAHGVGGQPPLRADVGFPFQVLVSELAEAGDFEASFDASAGPVTGCPPVADENLGTGSRASLTATVHVNAKAFAPAGHPEHEEHGGFDLFLDPGAERAWTFDDPGAYPYHDHLHPGLRGRIDVVAGGPRSLGVAVGAGGFEPANGTVGKQGTVRWRNDDAAPHSASADELHPEHARGPAPSPGAVASPPTAKPSPGVEAGALGLALGFAARRRRRAP
jgi:plastocyanin